MSPYCPAEDCKADVPQASKEHKERDEASEAQSHVVLAEIDSEKKSAGLA
jgi:hypothetical protein